MNLFAWLLLAVVVAPAAFVVPMFMLKASLRGVDPDLVAREDEEQMHILWTHSGPQGGQRRQLFLTTH